MLACENGGSEHGHEQDDTRDLDGHWVIVHQVVSEAIEVPGGQLLGPLVGFDGACCAEVGVLDGDRACSDIDRGGAVVVSSEALSGREDVGAIEDAFDLAREIDEHAVLRECLVWWCWEITKSTEHCCGEDCEEDESDAAGDDWFACDGVGLVDELFSGGRRGLRREHDDEEIGDEDRAGVDDDEGEGHELCGEQEVHAAGCDDGEDEVERGVDRARVRDHACRGSESEDREGVEEVVGEWLSGFSRVESEDEDGETDCGGEDNPSGDCGDFVAPRECGGDADRAGRANKVEDDWVDD